LEPIEEVEGSAEKKDKKKLKKPGTITTDLDNENLIPAG